MTLSILANKLDNCFVVQLLEPAIKPSFSLEIYAAWGSNIGKVILHTKHKVNELLMFHSNCYGD